MNVDPTREALFDIPLTLAMAQENQGTRRDN
jgi:hypothetical protein